jgi:hypothetical protein
MKTALVFLALALSVQAQAVQKTVCTLTINSTNERELFKKNLPAEDFKFVELTDYDTANRITDRNESQWLKRACEAGVQCDIIVASGHFGGFFFGSSGYQLTVPALENHSCNNTCDGILKRPKEVFLFGCNTLAEKGKDSRTQQQYIDVLISDGYRPDMATQVAETRYGAVGSTFKDQMRRVFAGVPHIYGFSSVSPSGANVAPALRKYFQSIPNYSAHLDQMARTLAPNAELNAIGLNALAQTSGVGVVANDAGIPYRHQICQMYDNGSTLADRTAAIAKMLRGPDRFIFLTSVVSFLNQNITAIQADYWANDALMKVARDSQTMAAIDQLKNSATTSLNLRLDLMDLEVKLGRMSRADFNAQGLALLKPLVRNLSQANADLVCSAMHAHGFKISVKLEDFAEGVLSKTAALSALQCLQTTDERVTGAIVPMINSNAVRNDGNQIRAYLLALTRLPGHNEEKVKVANYANQYSPSFAPYAYGLLTAAATGNEQVTAASMLARQEVNNIALSYAMLEQLPRQEGLAVSLLTALPSAQSKQSYRQQLTTVIRTLPMNSAYWNNVAQEVQKQDKQMQALYMGLVAQAPSIPRPMANLAAFLLTQQTGFGTYDGAVLAHAELTPDQQVKLAEIANQDPNSGDAALIRWVLSVQPNLDPQLKRNTKGPAYRAVCEVIGDILQCRGEKIFIK